jgi:MFS family permease
VTTRSSSDSGAAPSDFRTPALLVLLGGLVCQMGLGYSYVFGALNPDIMAETGWTKSMLSGARAPQLWVMALASPLAGFLVVRVGARAVLVASTVLLGAAFLLLSRIDALWQLYACFMLIAIAGTGLSDVTVGQAVAQWFVRHRGLALGIVYTGSNLGGALLVRYGGAIAEAGSWRTTVAVMGVGAFVLMLPLAAFAVRPPARSEVERIAASDAEKVTLGSEDDLDLRAALRTRSFWILSAALFVFFFYFVAILDHLVFHLIESGYEKSEAQAFLSNALILGMISKVGFGWVADRLPTRTATLLQFGLFAASSFLLLLPVSTAALWLFVATFGISGAARDVVYPMMIARSFGLRAMAEIYGTMMLVLPAGAAGAYYAAQVSESAGSYRTAFLTFAVLNVLTFASLLLLRDERVRATQAPTPSAS